MEVVLVTAELFKKVEAFLKNIPAIDALSPEVINKSVVLCDESEIKGIITYERFGSVGLIRYFIFQKDIPLGWVNQLFETLVKTAKSEEIKKIVSIVQKPELVAVFASLGFKKVPNANLYFNELPLLKTSLSPGAVLVYSVK